MSIKVGTFAVAMRAFLFCCVLTAPAFAQTYTLQGKVSDSAGHAVPSATVSAALPPSVMRMSASRCWRE